MAIPMYGQNKYDDARDATITVETSISASSVTTGFELKGHMRPTDTVTDIGSSGGAVPATDVDLTPQNSGLIVLVPALTGGTHTLELPACANSVGCTWTFVLTATAGQDFDVTTNGSEKILGAVPKGDGDNAAASDANDSCGFDANAIIGSRFSITCISTTAGTAFIAHDILDGLAANTGGINLK
jgi:hypothetical protein